MFLFGNHTIDTPHLPGFSDRIVFPGRSYVNVLNLGTPTLVPPRRKRDPVQFFRAVLLAQKHRFGFSTWIVFSLKLRHGFQRTIYFLVKYSKIGGTNNLTGFLCGSISNPPGENEPKSSKKGSISKGKLLVFQLSLLSGLS